MTLKKSTEFKYVDRNFKDTIALIPGWAADYRMFELLDLKFNYLIPISLFPDDFEKKLESVLHINKIEKFSLLGLSMGGFLSAAFAEKNENIIDQLILVGIRKQYKAEELATVRGYLTKGKKAFLQQFYLSCLWGSQRQGYFAKNLLEKYAEEFDLEYLLETLDYLKGATITPRMLENIKKVKIIHGEHDNVAPIEEARYINDKLPNASFIEIKNSGHIPPFNQSFAKLI